MLYINANKISLFNYDMEQEQKQKQAKHIYSTLIRPESDESNRGDMNR